MNDRLDQRIRRARQLHENVPPDWYYQSVTNNLLQRFWHQRRFEEVRRIVEPTNGVVLDIGSADGLFSQKLLEWTRADKLIGIDVLPKSIAWANNHWEEQPMEFKLGDAHNLDFEDESFAAVFALEVMEHVEDASKIVSEAFRVLVPGGYFVTMVPTDNRLFRLIWFLWTRTRGKIWTDTHVNSFRDDLLPQILKGGDFEIEKDYTFLLGMLRLTKARKPNAS